MTYPVHKSQLQFYTMHSTLYCLVRPRELEPAPAISPRKPSRIDKISEPRRALIETLGGWSDDADQTIRNIGCIREHRLGIPTNEATAISNKGLPKLVEGLCHSLDLPSNSIPGGGQFNVTSQFVVVFVLFCY